MDAKKYEVSVPRAGMNKSTDYRNLEATEYTHASNVNIESVDGDYIDATYEKSNNLEVNFPEGYKVIGRVNRLSNNYTYFFLHNPQTNKNIFGYTDNKERYEDKEDFEDNLQPPLEETEQTPFQKFNVLIDDSCLLEGFNFHIDYPIQNIVVKEEKTGAELYFTDFRNPSRYIKVDDIEYYFTEEVPCDDDKIVRCPNLDKMRIHTLYKFPEIKDISVNIGGSLSKGTYTFLVALSDSQGNEISEYTSITQPVDIFEHSFENTTNKAIRLTIESLDENFSHYKVVVLHRQHLDAVMTPYDVGVYSSSTKEVVISSLDYAQRTSLEKLSALNQKVIKSEGLTVVNNSLMEYGIVFQKEINLQPIVNLMGSYLEWQTHQAHEDLYNKGDLRSKYLGINRNEVVPYSIRFLIEGGTTTALFPLVGREATSEDRRVVLSTNKDRASFENSLECTDNNRTQNWQYYNTAKVTATESQGTVVETEYDMFDYCEVENVATVQGGTYTFSSSENFFDLKSYIEDNLENCSGQLSQMGLCAPLKDDYSNLSCSIQPSGQCTTPQKIDTEVFVSEVVNEITSEAYDTDTSNYQTTQPEIPFFNPYIRPYSDQTNGVDKVYNRQEEGSGNLTKQRAYKLSSMSQYNFVSNFQTYDCLTPPTSSYNSPNSLSGGLFQTTLHPKAKWYNVPTDTGKVIFISKEYNNPPIEDNFPNDESLSFNDTRRLSIFKDSSNSALYSFNFDSQSGVEFVLYVEGSNLIVRMGAGSETTIGTVNTNEKIYFTIETPMTSFGTECIIQPTWGAYNVSTADLKTSGTKLSFDEIKISVKFKYKSTCTQTETTIGNCEAQPYQRGTFAYWESEATYPDNQDLFDSTKLIINDETLKPQYKQEFLDKFIQGGMVNGKYRVKNSFNLACKPIRHFKFPDNKVSPFMTSNETKPFSEATIFPLGVTINEEVVNMLLDIAVDSNLIDKELRKDIYGYEIFRGDLSVSRSVFASGLLYDLRSYEEDNKEVHYPNYPYNTFRDDIMNQITKAQSFGDLFTFHSPETDYSTQSNIPTELNIQGYQFGRSSGYFDQVEDHPKWVILSKEAYNMASTLASLEVAGEALIETAKAVAGVPGWWAVAGTGSTGTNAGGWGVQIAAAALVGATILAEGIIYNYGRYKIQWHETFRNLGRGHNFASYYFSHGYYNYLETLQEQGNSSRSLQAVKNIKDGRYEINNRVSKRTVTVNNIDREFSTYIDLGKNFKIDYPSQYVNFDTRSLTYLSENGQSTQGRSEEIISNIASPYVQVINYNPLLHGEINSVVWVSTSHRGDLREPKTNIQPIFGGDTYISRHTLKRKMPMFLTTAMGQSMTTPFEYKFYNNIGKNPKFFLNFDITGDFDKKGSFFPEVKSEYSLDSVTENKFYITSPSKFYLYYYGVPSFLVETRINTNYREFGRTPSENFYPEVGDIGRWTQENTVPIRTPNFFKYSNTYSNQVPRFNSRVLGTNFTQKLQDTVEKTFNGVITSLPDANENSTINPWLRFRPLDFHEFETKYGKLTELKGIENEAILARFENTSIIYNKVDTNVDDGNQTSAFLGGTSMFQRRTTSFVNSELGYGGSKHKESLSCEFGHFYADLDRGQVIQIPSGGGNMIEISNVNQFNKPTNMKDWFKRNLPLKLMKSNINWLDEFNEDNSYNKVGITFGYDSLHKRILITKKDYVPVSECQIYYTEDEGFFTDGCVPPVEVCPEGYERVTEIIECGLRLAIVLENHDTTYLQNSIQYFRDLLGGLSGNIQVSFYYSRGAFGQSSIIQEDLNLQDAVTFINSFTGTLGDLSILSTTICEATQWLNQDTTKTRMIHGFYIGMDDWYYGDFTCNMFNTQGLLDTVNMTKNTDVIVIGSGINSPISSMNFTSPGMWFEETTLSPSVTSLYSNYQCDGESEVVNTCRMKVITPACPEGYQYNPTTNSCDPINNIPQKDQYESLDVVYYIGFKIPKDQYDLHKASVIASINALDSNPQYTNNRYALVIDDYTKSSNSKYKNLVPFTNNKQDIITAVNSLVHNYEHKNLYYSPDDLVIESILKNYKERSNMDNSFIESSNSLGAFRTDSQVGRVIYRLPANYQGTGLRMEYSQTTGQPTYAFNVLQTSKEYYDYIRDNEVLVEQNNVQIFTFWDSWYVSDVPPSTQNNYHFSQGWESKNIIATTPCYHYFESYRAQDQVSQIVQSISNIGYRSCQAESIPTNCGCTIEESYCVCYEYADPYIDYNKQSVELTDTEFFKEVSWTIAYHPQFGMFTSFHDYLPNYYVNHQDYFSSGRNDLNSLWAHNQTNKSFGVFYGSKNPMEIETLTKSTDGAYLGTVSLFTEAKRYYNNQDFYINRDLTFNRSIIYNKRHCSGELTMDLVVGGTRFLSRYPINVSDTNQRIPITKTENRFNYSYFYDRTIRDKNLPFIKNDDNQIKIEVSNISFNQGKGQLPRIFGDFFLNRLYYDTDSRFAMTLKLQKSLTNMHMKE